MKYTASPNVRDRLRAACAALERIEQARYLSDDPHLGRSLENRLIRRELFDLELQELDEQFVRVCEFAGTLSASLPPSERSKP